MSRKKFLALFFIIVLCWAFFFAEIKLIESYNHTLASQKIVHIHPTATAIPPDYNGGITISGSISVSSDTNIYPPDFDIVVLNHTDEPITFYNKGFGLVVYWGDGIAKEWKVVTLHPSPDDFPAQVTLEAHTESWIGNNRWVIHGSDLKAYYHWNPLRAYVGGIGKVTGRQYIAYWDILVIEKPASP
jgi:hypothetical protein